ncbi:hypothetical protein Golomagni_00250 [Golovinomyces magnicellulatus]|nr:hypothetical protein Golomagni_00250 [Golovinomyces magnicellulatus]
MVRLLHHHSPCISRLPYQRFRTHYLQNLSLFLKIPHTSFPTIPCASVRRSYGSGPNPNPGQNPFKLWPFALITLVGSGAYAFMVNSRIVLIRVLPTEMQPNDQLNEPKMDTPTFSPSKVTVIYVLGGPGAGKGTQCAKLVHDYNFTHLSAGDLLRAEQNREGSEFGELIRNHIKEGKIVPMEVTVQLLKNAMVDVVNKNPDGRGKFLIDGFPRKMDQALKFEKTVCRGKFVLFFDCPEEEMKERLLKRGKTSGRSDDNIESILKRFRTFVETSMPVVEYFESQDRVVKIPASQSIEEVYKETCNKLEQKLGKQF